MILAIAAISIGAITVSLFADQHDWNTGKACLDCHDDVGQEFTDMLGTPGVEPHEGLSCTDCHQNVSADFDDQHAATLPNCTSCHSTVITNMSYDTEAHKEMLYNAGSSIYNKGPNEACIVCHTGFDVNTTFKRPDYFNFTVDSSYSITNVEVSTTTHQNTYTWTKTGELHTYIAPAGVNCGDGVDGCHNDVVTARGGISGGHHTATQPLNATHPMNTPCATCHVNSQEVPDTEYHAAKNITCANRLNGCHDRGDTHVSTNMTKVFNEITTATGMSHQKEGDICWGCHSGYNWLDPVGSGGPATHTWVNYTTDAGGDIPNHGTVLVGTEANTHGAGTEDIQEVDIGGTTLFSNYTVASDLAVEGTVTNDWTFIDEGELPAGDIESIEEVSSGGDTWANYTVASDVLPIVEGTITGGDWQSIDENPPTGDTEDIQEVLTGGAGGSTNYDYTTYGVGDKQGYHVNLNGGTVNTADWDMGSGGGWTELTAAEYGQVAALNDASVWQYDSANAKYWRYAIHINEAEGAVTGIDALWDAERIERAVASPVTLHLWDDTAGQWVQIATGSVIGNNQPLQLTGSAAGTMADYIDAGGYVYVGVYAVDPGATARWIETDYVNITITTTGTPVGSLEHRWTTDNIPIGYTALNLYVRGLSTAPGDDTFSIEYSTAAVGGPYIPTGITINQGVMTTYAPFAMPGGLSGSIWIRVIDDNTGDVVQTTCQIDTIRLEWYLSNPATASLEHNWTTNSIPAGYSALNLYVRGLSSDPGDDVFSVFWSNDGASWVDTGINIDQGVMTTYAPYTFPLGESGVLYIQVIDDNTGDAALTTCQIDTIRIQHESLAPSAYSLEHRWLTQALPPGADDLTLLVNGSHNVGSDDTFTFEYSTDNVVYTPVALTINSNILTAYSVPLPVMSGQIYLRVVDDNSADAAQQDTVSIDEIHIMWHDLSAAAGSGLTIQVWSEPSDTVNVWNESSVAFEQVWPRAVTGCEDCHDDTGTNPVPFGSGKYINHLNESISNYDYTHCEDCHNTAAEPWYPHDIPHAIDIDWTAYAAAGDTNVNNDFCNVICHYSDLDSRAIYQDASTPWMADIYTSFTNDGALHTTSTLIDADGVVECVDCHPDHLQMPNDGGLSVQGCGDPSLGVGGCHVPFQGWVNKTDTPSSHGDPWPASYQDCTKSGCHEKHNYPLDPSEGHNPTANCHPGGISCGVDSNSHTKHIVADWGIPDYDYNCSQCHFNAAGDLDGWYDTTYGTPEHNNGVLNVHFNGTSPLSTVAIANHSGDLSTTFNGTGNMDCANTYCHSDGLAGSFSWNAPDPEWDTPGVACGDCHNMAPTTSSHPRHTDGAPYEFNCSECHFNPAGNAAGWYDSTYGTSQHVDGQVQVVFNNTANGLALHFGDADFLGSWSGGNTCSDIWCHNPSDGADTSAGDTTPVWDTPATTYCGAGGGGSCHGDRTAGNTPLSGAHNKHVANNLPDTSNSPNYNYACAECHNGGAVDIDTYGTVSHVDGIPTMVFDELAVGTNTNRAGILGSPSYAPGASLRTGTCSSVYCHSNGVASEAGSTGPGGIYAPADIGNVADETNVY
ncbi:MAG: CxxxxCH/CxxCH domain-containing protein, partial [Thermoplasmata archaeon]|nr:CxxxxCH/CxxCH domain-containing protein [Thermoplasmata archaeon]